VIAHKVKSYGLNSYEKDKKGVLFWRNEAIAD